MSPRYLKPAPTWRVDVYPHGATGRDRREFTLESEARAFWAQLDAAECSAMLLRRGYADRATRDAGANSWNVVAEI